MSRPYSLKIEGQDGLEPPSSVDVHDQSYSVLINTTDPLLRATGLEPVLMPSCKGGAVAAVPRSLKFFTKN